MIEEKNEEEERRKREREKNYFLPTFQKWMTWFFPWSCIIIFLHPPSFSFFPQVNSPPLPIPCASILVSFTSLSSSRGKNVCTIMVSGSADGAFGMLSPFFWCSCLATFCDWPFFLHGATLFLLQPANGDGLWLSPRPPVGCRNI